MDSFYANKRIFLTGATGFLGKTVLYKILTSLPSVTTIYVLIRAKVPIHLIPTPPRKVSHYLTV
jgi:FlaA1/EpsC-like NDP-sugar epimerase